MSCAIRFRAISQYSSFNSIPIVLVPNAFAAIKVLPLPANGSSNKGFPGGAKRLIRYFISAKGFTVGCEHCLSSPAFRSLDDDFAQ